MRDVSREWSTCNEMTMGRRYLPSFVLCQLQFTIRFMNTNAHMYLCLISITKEFRQATSLSLFCSFFPLHYLHLNYNFYLFFTLFSMRPIIIETEHKLVMVGLDNAGKTTILYQFLMNEVVHTSPTIGSNVEEIVWKNIHFLVWDLAGNLFVHVCAFHKIYSKFILILLDLASCQENNSLHYPKIEFHFFCVFFFPVTTFSVKFNTKLAVENVDDDNKLVLF